MNNTLSDALDTFSTTLTSSINITDILGVYGKAVAASILIFLGVWGGRKLLSYVITAMNGRMKRK